MKVIILAAGIGLRLMPFTENLPKSLFALGKGQTILGRMIGIVKRNSKSEICVVTGFMHDKIESSLQGVNFVFNPFYKVTNSIASLWFARDYLDGDVIIINSDIVIEEVIFKELLKVDSKAMVLIDGSKIHDADYKVATYNGRVVMMSKDISTCSGDYAGITKLSKEASIQLRTRIEAMIHKGQIDEWYEDALVDMILSDDFVLNFYDISRFQWTEVDTPDDLLLARKICETEENLNG